MKSALSLFYQKLYSYFGPQRWWPGDSPFEVMVGAILTQNTNWSNVEKAIDNLKMHNLLDPERLYRLPEKRLAWLIVPAGYYNVKAERLKNFLNFLFKSYQGKIKKMFSEDIEELRPQLLSVKGIGPETADSILLYALEKPIFVVDAYTRRVLFRHRLIREDARYEEIQNLFMKDEPLAEKGSLRAHLISKKDGERNRLSCRLKLFNEYHALLVRLGKEFCLKNKPRCLLCPLK